MAVGYFTKWLVAYHTNMNYQWVSNPEFETSAILLEEGTPVEHGLRKIGTGPNLGRDFAQ